MSRPYNSMKPKREKMRNLWRASATLPERVVEDGFQLRQT